MDIHFNFKMDIIVGKFDDGSQFVGLIFCDRETGEKDAYPIPAELAKNFGKEIMQLSKKAKKMKEES